MSLLSLCKRPVVKASPDQNVIAACRLLKENNVGCIVVEENDKLCGIVTDRDIVVRAVAGAAAVNLPISEWLVLCTALLALFLGFAKRRGELVMNGNGKTKTRAVLDSYSLELVDQLLTIVAASTIVAYGLYALENPARGMVATMPFVLFGVFRYLLLIHRDNLGEEPERVLLRDKQLLGAVVLWAITAAIILAAS